MEPLGPLSKFGWKAGDIGQIKSIRSSGKRRALGHNLLLIDGTGYIVGAKSKCAGETRVFNQSKLMENGINKVLYDD